MREKSNITAIYVGVVVGLVLVSLSLMLGGGMMGGWGMMSGYEGGWGWNQGSLWMVVVGSILMVILGGAVIFGVVTMMRKGSSRVDNRVDDIGETNLALLKRRYASGELTKEQFENAREALRV